LMLNTAAATAATTSECSRQCGSLLSGSTYRVAAVVASLASIDGQITADNLVIVTVIMTF
jgi:hypothetical protein